MRKRNAKGEVCRYRTRITIQGCQQEFGINFWETYAPVAKAKLVKFFAPSSFLGPAVPPN